MITALPPFDASDHPDVPGFERAMRELLIRLAEFEARPEAAMMR